MSGESRPGGALTGEQVLELLVAGTEHLRQSAPAIDAINVYPVPDGDTGSNMAATLAAAVEAAREAARSPGHAGEVLAAFARGSLYGARGNSGVILSQALQGLASAVTGPALDGAALASALRAASAAAYRALSSPVEGTMLTVLRMAGESATKAASRLPADGAGQGCLRVLERAVASAEEAEARTPELLPALAQAGVTDAGGEGICALLRGMLGALTGKAPTALSAPETLPVTMRPQGAPELGFCTQFLIEVDDGMLDMARVRALAEAPGNRSVAFVASATSAQVHVHTEDPESVIARFQELGRVSRVKIDDMSAQHMRWSATGSGAVEQLGVLALAADPGWQSLFQGLGTHAAGLGEGLKPAAGEIAAAAESLGIPDVIVLPNHREVVATARQAAGLARCTLHVIPARSLPAGLAAAIVFNPDWDVARNLQAMTEAAVRVRTVEVTRAAADRFAEGVSVREGEAIALVDGKLAGARDTFEGALLFGLDRAGALEAGLITLYAGAGISQERAEQTEDLVKTAFPNVEVEVLAGGQALYPYLASVEQ